MSTLDEKMAAVLSEYGIVSPDDLERVREKSSSSGRPLGDVLLEDDLLNSDQLLWLKSQAHGVPLVHVDPEAIDAELVRSFPADFLYESRAIPLLRYEKEITVALADPGTDSAIKEMARLSGCRVIPNLANPNLIRLALEAVVGPRGGAREPSDLITFDPTSFSTDDDSGVADIFFNIVKAIQKSADEILFRPAKEGLKISVRVGGTSEPLETTPPERIQAILSRLRTMARLEDRTDPLPTRTLTLSLMGKKHRLTFILLRSADGDCVKIRIRREDAEKVTAFDAPADIKATLETLVRGKGGLLLVNSPDTAAAAGFIAKLLDEAAPDREILFLGDKDLPHPAQSFFLSSGEVKGASSNASADDLFTAGTDITVVDASRGATDAPPLSWALTGRLLILLLPFSSATAGLRRLAAYAQDASMLSAVYAGSLAFRTFPLLGEKGRTPAAPSAELAALFAARGLDAAGANFFRPKPGAATDGSAVLCEWLPPSDKVSDWILDGTKLTAMRELIPTDQTIFGQAFRLAANGTLCVDELVRF